MIGTEWKRLVVPTLGIITMTSSTFANEGEISKQIQAAKEALIEKHKPITLNKQLLETIDKAETSLKGKYNNYIQDLKSGELQKTISALTNIGKIKLLSWIDGKIVNEQDKLITTLNAISGSKETNITKEIETINKQTEEDKQFDILRLTLIADATSDQNDPNATFVLSDIPTNIYKTNDNKIIQMERHKLSEISSDFTTIDLIQKYNKIGLTHDELNQLLPDITNDKAEIESALKKINDSEDFKKIYAKKLSTIGITIDEEDIKLLHPYIEMTVAESWKLQDKKILDKYDKKEITADEINKYNGIIQYIETETKTKITPTKKYKKAGEKITLTTLYDDETITKALDNILKARAANDKWALEQINEFNEQTPGEKIDTTNIYAALDVMTTNYLNLISNTPAENNDLEDENTKLKTEVTELRKENQKLRLEKTKIESEAKKLGHSNGSATFDKDKVAQKMKTVITGMKDTNKLKLLSEIATIIGINPEAIKTPK